MEMASEEMHVDRDRLQTHISELSQAPRPARSSELVHARNYVQSQFEQCGWIVQRHKFSVTSDMGQPLTGINLVARHPDLFDENLPRFCVGAHVDSKPDSPGADDNASAVAAMLEIARLLPDSGATAPKVALELVGFHLEENGMLGGAEHARVCRDKNIDLRGMVSLEMLGYCDHRPGTQMLPKTLVGLYPDVGNFIAVVGNQNSDELIQKFADGMKCVEGLPVEMLAVPENGNELQATRLSDHSPFWDAGYAALMITDTSFLRNPHYHMATDTLDTLDMEFLERVSQGCLSAVQAILKLGL